MVLLNLMIANSAKIRYYCAMSICAHGNSAPDQVLGDLHESQAGPGVQRHKCTECAYEQGYRFGRLRAVVPGGNAECKQTGRRAPQDVIENLPESQAGPGRHKCAVCAFHEGFQRARSEAERRPST